MCCCCCVVIVFCLLASVSNIVNGITCHNYTSSEVSTGALTGQATCSGSYCLYEKIITNGETRIARDCSDIGQIVYTGGYFTDINKCFETTVGDTSYSLKICNSGDYCNYACNSGLAPTQSSTTILLSTLLVIFSIIYSSK
uniref:Secreted protein n=1 Tax=Strongyloides papillosus TaxID=174720 RepID=A0A0N5CE27_STREA